MGTPVNKRRDTFHFVISSGEVVRPMGHQSGQQSGPLWVTQRRTVWALLLKSGVHNWKANTVVLLKASPGWASYETAEPLAGSLNPTKGAQLLGDGL